MSDTIQFIFSTRFLGDVQQKISFSQRTDLEKDTPVYAYLRSALLQPEVFLQTIRLAKSTGKGFGEHQIYFNPDDDDDSVLDTVKTQMSQNVIRDEYNNLIDYLFSQGIAPPIISKKIANCPGKTVSDKLKSRFSYYLLNNHEAGSSTNAVAVPHLDWNADVEWIKALIEWSFRLDAGSNELFLVMHDDDVPGFSHEPYKQLTGKQVYDLLKAQNTEKAQNTDKIQNTNSDKCLDFKDEQ